MQRCRGAGGQYICLMSPASVVMSLTGSEGECTVVP